MHNFVASIEPGHFLQQQKSIFYNQKVTLFPVSNPPVSRARPLSGSANILTGSVRTLPVGKGASIYDSTQAQTANKHCQVLKSTQ